MARKKKAAEPLPEWNASFAENGPPAIVLEEFTSSRLNVYDPDMGKDEPIGEYFSRKIETISVPNCIPYDLISSYGIWLHIMERGYTKPVHDMLIGKKRFKKRFFTKIGILHLEMQISNMAEEGYQNLSNYQYFKKQYDDFVTRKNMPTANDEFPF